MPFDPPFAHLLGVPLEELMPGLLGLGAVLAYLRLRYFLAVKSGSFVVGAIAPGGSSGRQGGSWRRCLDAAGRTREPYARL